MPKQISLTVYSFQELEPKAKARAIQDARDFLCESYDGQELTNRFREVLAAAGFTNVEPRWSLGHCQGDGVAFYGKPDIEELAKCNPHVKELYDKILKLDPGISVTVEIEKCQVFHMYDHWNTMLLYVYGDDNTDTGELLNELEKHLRQHIKELSKELQRLGYEDYDAAISEDAAIDLLETNDYQFFASGEIYNP